MGFSRLFMAVLLVTTSAAAAPSDAKHPHHKQPPNPNKLQASLNMKTNFVGGMNNIIANDQARLKKFGHNSVNAGNSVPVPIIDSGVNSFCLVYYTFSDSQNRLHSPVLGGRRCSSGKSPYYVPFNCGHRVVKYLCRCQYPIRSYQFEPRYW